MAHIEINRIESVLSFAREAIVAKHGHALPYRMAMTAGLAFCQHHRRAFSILRHPSRSRKHRVPARATVQLVRKISVIMPPPCAQTPVEVLGPGLLPPYSGRL